MLFLKSFETPSLNTDILIVYNDQTNQLFCVSDQIANIFDYSHPFNIYKQAPNNERFQLQVATHFNSTHIQLEAALTYDDIIQKFKKHHNKTILYFVSVQWLIERSFSIEKDQKLVNIFKNCLQEIYNFVHQKKVQAQVQMLPSLQTSTIDNNIKELLDIIFEGDHIKAVSRDGNAYIGIKSICDNLGIIDSRHQIDKIKDHPVLSTGLVNVDHEMNDGRKFNINCINLKFLPGWLFNINPNNVLSEAREKLIKYQIELHDYLSEKVFGTQKQITKFTKEESEVYIENIVHTVKLVDKIVNANVDDYTALSACDLIGTEQHAVNPMELCKKILERKNAILN